MSPEATDTTTVNLRCLGCVGVTQTRGCKTSRWLGREMTILTYMSVMCYVAAWVVLLAGTFLVSPLDDEMDIDDQTGV
jgi:hypothetical protein